MRAFAIAGLIFVLTGANAPARAEAPVPDRLRPAISRIDALAAAEHAKDNVGGLTIGGT